MVDARDWGLLCTGRCLEAILEVAAVVRGLVCCCVNMDSSLYQAQNSLARSRCVPARIVAYQYPKRASLSQFLPRGGDAQIWREGDRLVSMVEAGLADVYSVNNPSSAVAGREARRLPMLG